MAHANVPFLLEILTFCPPKRIRSGSPLTVEDARNTKTPVHVYDWDERIGGFQEWLGVDHCSKRVEIPL
jgi:hypothetical protein